MSAFAVVVFLALETASDSLFFLLLIIIISLPSPLPIQISRSNVS